MALAMIAAACGDDDVSAEGLTFGMIMVGPENDRGWSQAHFEGGEYVEEMTGAEMISFEKANNADNPGITVSQIVDQMVEQGAELIFATSDDMKEEILTAAANHPDVPMIWSSGDNAWADGKDYRSDLTNLGNSMGRMEYGKLMAGCAAGLTTQTGSIAYLGPLINDETRRLVNSAYLGAQYCWTEYRERDAAELDFQVNWIGFWFNIPGVTLDPTQVTNEFFDGGADVVISGIDTTEALVEAGKRGEAGEAVWAVPYDFIGACDQAPEVCLGVPYFNWGPSYLEIIEEVVSDDFDASFDFNGPNWDDLNDLDSTAIGFISGPGLSDDAEGDLDDFIEKLAGDDIKLFVGPLNYQDGTPWLADGEEASDFQVWYTEQLLEGITGASE
jgi:simple sugar transport system substrate-binding protein